jgi:predicted ribosomally synthesized peptide with SipW-like signal peptide
MKGEMKMNKKILASIFVIGILALAMGWGTYSWFSDTETSNEIILTAGTMDIEILETGPVSTPAGWAPGDSFTVTIKVKNVGNIPVKYLGGNLILTSGTAGFANVIEVTSIAEYIPGSPAGWYESINGYQKYEELVKDYNPPLTLMELAKSYWGTEPDWESGRKKDQFDGWVNRLTDWVTGGEYDQVPTNAIPVGETYWMQLTLKFSEGAGNEWKGATLGFKIQFVAAQDLSVIP